MGVIGGVIYQPKGKAGEYSRLALNLYETCPHACTYCYAPGCLRKTPAQHHRPAVARRNILSRLEKDCKNMKGDPREILLCFTCDPFPMRYESEDDMITRDAMQILQDYDMHVQFLTKAGISQVSPFLHIIKRNGWKLGASISWATDALRKQHEPGAAPLSERFSLLSAAHDLGIPTWLSIEPVIVPENTLRLIATLPNYVDLVKLGKLNHDKEAESRIDWKSFLATARAFMKTQNIPHMIKYDLIKAAER
jgi:DNA repair photolyase